MSEVEAGSKSKGAKGVFPCVWKEPSCPGILDIITLVWQELPRWTTALT